MKPTWHRGTWTVSKTQALIHELTQAQQHRSLTAEEQAWLAQVHPLHDLHQLFDLKD